MEWWSGGVVEVNAVGIVDDQGLGPCAGVRLRSKDSIRRKRPFSSLNDCESRISKLSQYSTTPLLHFSSTPSLHYSITPFSTDRSAGIFKRP